VDLVLIASSFGGARSRSLRDDNQKSKN